MERCVVNTTKIEWCHRPETGGAAGAKTWNPIRARMKREHISNPAYRPSHSGTFCTRISPGCTHCYASAINKRFGNGLDYTVPNLEKIEFFIDERILAEPLKAKKPHTIFVGDMFDLFHEAIGPLLIAEVLDVMRRAPQHTYQLLTKRAARMREMMTGLNVMPHVWLGVSVEDQKRADERIPLLLQTPAAVRFLSVEPQLEAVDLSHYVFDRQVEVRHLVNGPACLNFDQADYSVGPSIDWVIVGGESGPGARPFNPAWAHSIIRQCALAKVPCFVKQVGSNPEWDNEYWQGLVAPKLKDRKGGDPAEWPAALRVREFPSQKVESVST